MNNNGIISIGDNNINQIANNNLSCYAIDWEGLEKELADLKANNNLNSIKDFIEEVTPYVETRNNNGFIKCLQKLGKVGLEIITKTSATIIAEIVKRYMP